ncbi:MULTISPECIES: general stress protein [unclassified Rathayibacter]|uniref:general stress protein n=1 Tax=unclassified Rathayibacter TaxID=2609250 RepID=UPI0021573A8B|nr:MULTISPECIES: general stress protein [unclassified Rathayibacter]
MTQQTPFSGRGPAFPSIPRGEILATFDTYQEAQAAVDVLARADFPVRQLAIIGNELKSVERVTGKLTWGRVALAGAASGAWLGVFLGLLLIIFSPTTEFSFLIAAVLLGAGFGMLFGLASYAVNRRRRDFTSTMQVIATSYSVLVDPEVVNRARNLLDGGTSPAEAPQTAWAPPPAAVGDPQPQPVRPEDDPR